MPKFIFNHKPFLCLVLVLFCVVSPLNTLLLGQESTNTLSPDKKLSQFTLDVWSHKDGLPSSGQTKLLQTKNGYFWIATYSGLIYFDGASFTTFNKNNENSFISNNIYDLVTDKDGKLWLGTHTGGLISYKKNIFKRYPGDANFPYVIQTMQIDNKANKIWIGTRGNGVYSFKDLKYTKLDLGPDFDNIFIYQILLDKNGKLWISTEDDGLISYYEGKVESYNKTSALLSNRIGMLFIDQQDKLWVSTASGVYIYNGQNFTRFDKLGNDWVARTLQDKYQNYWFATNVGLARYNPHLDEISWLNEKNGMPHQEITDLAFDIEGSLWLATVRGGLIRLKEGKFTTYSRKNGIRSKSVSSVLEIGPHKFLVATDEGLINQIEYGKVGVFPIKSNLPSRIRDISKKEDGSLLISSYKGVLKITPSGKESWYNDKNILPHNTARLSFEDNQNNIWIGTRAGGLVKIKPDGKTVYFNTENGLSSNFIMSITQGVDNKIVVGTNNGGVNFISEDHKIKVYKQKNGLASDLVFNTYYDKDNVLWIVTISGISRFENEKFFNFTSKNGLPEATVFDFIEDDHGYVWLPSSIGIIQVSKNDFNDILNNKKTSLNTRIYDKQDGMIVSEATGAAHVLKDSNGKIWFPTLGGVVVVNPVKIPINKQKPPVVINRLTIDGKRVNLEKEIEVSEGQKRYIFDYTALSLLAPSKVNFKYQLLNFDKDWVDAGTQRQAIYTNLSAGYYTFKVIACNNDGIWNYQGDALSFKIDAAFYQTPIFYAISSILIILIAIGIFRWRLYEIRRYNIRLNQIVSKRKDEILEKNNALEVQKDKIEGQKANISYKNRQLEQINEELRALSEEKNNLIGIVAHDLRNPLNHIDGLVNIIKMTAKNLDEEQSQYINMIKDSTSRLHRMISKILDVQAIESKSLNLNIEKVFISEILDEVTNNMEVVANNKNIQLIKEFNANGSMALVDKSFLLQIYENLISNAIKFSPKNTDITIKLSEDNSHLKTEIIDQGPGLTENDKDKLFKKFQTLSAKTTNNESSTGLGLSIVKKYTEAMNGNVYCESEEGKGANFIVTFEIAE